MNRKGNDLILQVIACMPQRNNPPQVDTRLLAWWVCALLVPLPPLYVLMGGEPQAQIQPTGPMQAIRRHTELLNLVVLVEGCYILKPWREISLSNKQNVEFFCKNEFFWWVSTNDCVFCGYQKRTPSSKQTKEERMYFVLFATACHPCVSKAVFIPASAISCSPAISCYLGRKGGLLRPQRGPLLTVKDTDLLSTLKEHWGIRGSRWRECRIYKKKKSTHLDACMQIDVSVDSAPGIHRMHVCTTYACRGGGAVYLLGLVMPDPSLSVLLVRTLADLPVKGGKGKAHDISRKVKKTKVLSRSFW